MECRVFFFLVFGQVFYISFQRGKERDDSIGCTCSATKAVRCNIRRFLCRFRRCVGLFLVFQRAFSHATLALGILTRLIRMQIRNHPRETLRQRSLQSLPASVPLKSSSQQWKSVPPHDFFVSYLSSISFGWREKIFFFEKKNASIKPINTFSIFFFFFLKKTRC